VNPSVPIQLLPPTPARTPDEQSIIDLVARSHGREWAVADAELTLGQARALGEP
jgi:hypothetical protein